MKEETGIDGAKGRVIILDGTREDDQEARIVKAALLDELNRSKIGYTDHVLRDIEIAPCTGCLKCWTKTPGECIINDGQRRICSDMAVSNVVVLITPVTFGGYSSELKKGMDRLISDLLPFFRKYDGETHHPSRYGSGWNLFGVGTLTGKDEEKEQLFKEIVRRNSLNMHSKDSTSLIVLKGWNEKEISDRVIDGIRKVVA